MAISRKAKVSRVGIGKKLMFTVNKPFDLFLKLDDGYDMRGLVDELRTDYCTEILSFQSKIDALNQEFVTD
jgi:hypothetical protein